MKIVTHTLPMPKDGKIEIVGIADTHIGDPLSDWQAINRRIAYIRDTADCYTVLDGDLIDNAIQQSVGDTYRQVYDPTTAVQLVSKLLEPIKHKILGVCPGNHEARSNAKTAGIDLTQLICDQLGISHLYSPTSIVIKIRVGSQRYDLYMVHGHGGGRKGGGKLNNLVDLSSITDADIYIMGHAHQPMATRTGYMLHAGNSNKPSMKERLYVLLAASLQYGGYGDAQGYTPAAMTNPTIYLSATQKFAWATV